MAVVQLDDGRIADEFEIGAEPHILKDAIVMDPTDYEALTPDEIAALKQARYEKWIAIINAPPEEITDGE